MVHQIRSQTRKRNIPRPRIFMNISLWTWWHQIQQWLRLINHRYRSLICQCDSNVWSAWKGPLKHCHYNYRAWNSSKFSTKQVELRTTRVRRVGREDENKTPKNKLHQHTKWVSEAFLRLKNAERAVVARRVWAKNPKHIETNRRQKDKVAISHKVMVNKDRIKLMDQYKYPW